MKFERGNTVMVMADQNHKGIDDAPFYGFVDGWIGKVQGENSGLIEIRCRQEGKTEPGSSEQPESVPVVLLVPANELRLIRA